jgi:broad specificity phosphatase PhoE
MKLLFIRHGETTINEQGKVRALNDSAMLTKKGKQQIRSVIPICSNHLVEHIYCSPEPRAVESAHIISAANHTPVEFLPELRERNWGIWAEKPWGEIKKMLDDKTLV